MNFWLYMIIGTLTVVVGVLLYLIMSLRKSLYGITDQLKEKIDTDTNTPILVSSGDSSVKDLTKEINSRLATLRDERRKLQTGDAELKSAVTNISHDIRTPLTAIKGYLDLLSQENISQEASRYIWIIQERTDSLKELTEELLNYSVITSTTDQLSMKEILINTILQETMVDYYVALTERDITPVIQITDVPVWRMADESALRRVLGNIISNAVKYSDGDLEVTLTENGTIVFSNSAKELDVISTERLFDRFYTVTSARNSTGLGLSIAKLLTEEMGGTIDGKYKEGRLHISLKI